MTVRDHIASEPGIPDPPPGAAYVMGWEPYGPSRSQWVLGALDGPPVGDPVAILDGGADEHPGVLLERVCAALGCPVWLSQVECEDGYAYYVTPAGAP